MQTFPIRHDKTWLSADDLYLFNEGNHFRLFDKLGAHLADADGQSGVRFAVWAPSAIRLSVMGDFNRWNPDSHPLHSRGASGIWEGFVGNLNAGACYKLHVRGKDGYRFDKTDPFAFSCQVAPETGSLVTDLVYTWTDAEWMQHRCGRNGLTAPISVYEMHLGSWRRKPEDGNRSYTYRELAPILADYLASHGFTHVEFLPVMEHPFYGSWGYQMTGFFAPTSRYGSPQDFMYLIDQLHQRGIGVILDWVPSHFPCDGHGLSYFDGTHLYEHADARQGFHPDWKSYIFNYGRTEVTNFLINSALFWLEKYHVDGIRVDAVASMLYLDYSRQEGEWIPNTFGGRENLEAIQFLRRLNQQVYLQFPDVQTFAEESTAWPMVSRPTYLGGLGFGFKWDMGWMHDTLAYLKEDPINRKYHHNQLTFRSVYAFTENFILSLSHDEVVHGKRSLLDKMPGDEWQKRANLRLLLAYLYTQPGKKLLFMGGEFGQRREWNHDSSLDWNLLDDPKHQGLARWVGDLNHAYRSEPALHARDCEPAGFQWVEANDAEHSVLAYLRLGFEQDAPILAAFNFTPEVWRNYRIGVPREGEWMELLNSDAVIYGGSAQGNFGSVATVPFRSQGQPFSLLLTMPPLSMVLFKHTDPVSRTTN
ncbi:1,4-alpha-glucan branching protein GlgB [soil metagenome]